MDNSIVIDFIIDSLKSRDPRFLVVFDLSVWGALQGRPTKIGIVRPGATQPVEHYFDQGSNFVINSYMLDLSCIGCDGVEYLELPDGLYEITITSTPTSYTKTKKYFKTDQLEFEIDELILKYASDCDTGINSIKDKVTDFKLMLRGVDAYVKVDNICKAQELYNQVEKEVNRLSKCKSC